jgi:hypothetical protein
MFRRLALVALLAVVGASSATAATPKKFTPAALAGTWAGTWTNQTFTTTGTLTLKISSVHNALVFAATITGNTFGCAAPTPQAFKLPAGKGANHWTAKGFNLSNPSAAFGTMNITYAYPSGTLTGSGKAPACAPGIAWTLTGKFTAKTFNATASITLPGNSTATTVVSLTKK